MNKTARKIPAADGDDALNGGPEGNTERTEFLVRELELAQHNLFPLLSAKFREDKLALAIRHLTEVGNESENAANAILAAAEELGSLADDMPSALRDTVNAVSTRIFEACNFQDVSGQRLNKVRTTLDLMLKRFDILAGLIGEDRVCLLSEKWEFFRENEAEKLLQGPQLKGEGASQGDIDALLADFD